jgi:hypothetical protein
VNLSVAAIVTFVNLFWLVEVLVMISVFSFHINCTEILTSMKNQSMSDTEINRWRLCTEINCFYCGKIKSKGKVHPLMYQCTHRGDVNMKVYTFSLLALGEGGWLTPRSGCLVLGIIPDINTIIIKMQIFLIITAACIQLWIFIYIVKHYVIYHHKSEWFRYTTFSEPGQLGR